MEGIVLLLVIGLPWAFGGVDPPYELALAVGVALLVVLWAAIVCVNGRFNWIRCAVAPSLAGLVLLALFQLVPLPQFVLRVLSPGTAELWATMLPAEPEQLSPTATVQAAPTLRPISIYPHATKVELFHWLEILIVFTAVRNQIASTASVRRLAVVSLINGCALALYGLYQFFSTRAGGAASVYGMETVGRVFGPFINRNHAAAFLNLSIAVSVGLLLASISDPAEYKRRMIQKPNAPEEQDALHGFSPFAVLHSPVQLWTCVAITLMIAGVVCSLSRGGLASLVVALVVSLMLRLTWPPRIGRVDFLVLPTVFLMGLLAWVGFKPLETRLATLVSGGSFDASRWTIWTGLIELVPSYPLFGSGYGTLQYVEPLSRTEADPLRLVNFDYLLDHAHNDYLEALVEGGIVRFALTLAMVGAVLYLGFRGLRRYLTRTPGAFAFGCLFAVITLTIHSFFDFSATTPAVAILATVVAAQLVSLGRNDPTVPPSAAHAKVMTLRLEMLGRGAVAVVAFGLAGVLVLFAWNADRVYRLRIGAFNAVERNKPPDYRKAGDYLAAAVRRDPTDADLRIELGQTLLDARPGRGVQENEAYFASNVVPALEQFAIARNLCPALPRPQARFAAFANKLTRADRPDVYWQRAMKLAPSDAGLWFYHGLQAFKEGRHAEAYPSWKHALELKPKPHLDEVIELAQTKLSVDDLLAKVLPDNPEVILATAERLDPEYAKNPRHPPDPRLMPLFRKVVELLTALPDLTTADENYWLARASDALDERDDALRSYRTALGMATRANPNRNKWRYRYARLLLRSNKLEEAVQELRALQKSDPSQDVDDDLELVEHELNRR